MLICQPSFVTQDIFEAVKNTFPKKNHSLTFQKRGWWCVQVMHIGSYDDEPASVAAMDKYALKQGYVLDINDTCRHHEVYLSDPRKAAPEKLKTILRHPIRQP